MASSRCAPGVYLSLDSQAAVRLLTEGPWRGDHVRVVGLKAFADGALGSRGALLTDDYSDAPGERGLALLSEQELTALATRCLQSRVQLAVHAIGDLAVHRTLDAFAAARKAHPEARRVPLRIEHAQVVRPEDQIRFALLDVVASMQPLHATSDMAWAGDRLGDRLSWAYAWHDLRELDAVIAFGSDVPVEPADPGLGLWAATTRQPLDGGEALGGEPLSIGQALQAYTEGPAAAVGEPELGRIDVGSPADLTLWRVRPWQGSTRYEPVGTVVGGAIRWADDGVAAPAGDRSPGR